MKYLATSDLSFH